MSTFAPANLPSNPHAQSPVYQAGPPLEGAAAAIVLLHGRGGSAADILQLGAELIQSFPQDDVTLIAPEAGSRTWYPNSFLAERSENEPWLSSALGKVHAVVETIVASGVSRERIILAGFSQGACLATEFLASSPARYGALLAFTGGLIGPLGSDLRHSGDLAGTPALLLSGDPDPHVPWQRVLDSAVELRRMGALVETEVFPGRPHTVSRVEIELARKFLGKVIPTKISEPLGGHVTSKSSIEAE